MLSMSEWTAIHLKEKTTTRLSRSEMFYFFPKRTRPCWMLNTFHLLSCLPRLIVVLSPSTVDTTPSSYSAPCPCAHFLLWSYLEMALCRCIYCIPPEALQANKHWGGKSKARSNLDWRTNKCLIQLSTSLKNMQEKVQCILVKGKKYTLFGFNMLMYSWNHIVLGSDSQ